MLVAMPATAAQADSVYVIVDEPLAGETTDWMIKFTAASVYAAGDTIDITFPAGATIGTFEDIGTGATQAAAKSADGLLAVNATATQYNRTIRLTITEGFVAKYDHVIVNFTGMVNPASCFHTVQVQAVTSAEFPIYSLKMELVAGKNLISLPAYPEDEAIEVVLADLFAAAAADATFTFSVWYWDAAAQDWITYVSDTSFDDLATIEPGKAYWIKVSAAIDFYFKGDPYPSDQGPPVKFCHYVKSWNMVGFASLTEMVAEDYLAYAKLEWPTYDDAVIIIFTWDAAAEAWEIIEMDEYLVPGKGYFMAFLDAACIIPPVQ